MLALIYATLLLSSGGVATGKAVPPASLPRAIGACVAVTKADVQAVIGEWVDNGVEEVSGAESTCNYSGLRGQVTVTVHRLTAKLDMEAEIKNLEQAIPHSRIRPAQGFGRTALFLDIQDAGTQLHIVRDGRDYVMISVLGFGSPKNVSRAAEWLGRKALSRL